MSDPTKTTRPVHSSITDCVMLGEGRTCITGGTTPGKSMIHVSDDGAMHLNGLLITDRTVSKRALLRYVLRRDYPLLDRVWGWLRRVGR